MEDLAVGEVEPLRAGEGGMNSDPEFEEFADRAVASWGKPDGDYCYSELEADVVALYRSRLSFPPGWTEQQRSEFLAEHACRDASDVGDRFDDLIDTVTERLRRERYFECGGQPFSEEISAEIALARRDVLDDLRWRLIYDLPDLIQQQDRELAEELAREY